MKTIKISIPDMISSHCQMRVSNAISKIKGTTIKEIAPALATLTIDDNSLQQQVIDFIEDAGYKVAGIETAIANADNDQVMRFKTNINCSGCVAKVTPALNAKAGITEWDVDTTDKDKILTIKSNGISEDELIETIKQTGFKIEAV